MALVKVQKDKVLREVYRNYSQFREYVRSTGNHMIEYNDVRLSFYDLHRGLNNLSPRKRQAFYLNVIQDMKQREVAEIMGITTVSVGQYVQQAMVQLANQYFEGDDE